MTKPNLPSYLALFDRWSLYERGKVNCPGFIVMLYALPFVALGVAATLIIVFGIGVRLAERRLYPVSKYV